MNLSANVGSLMKLIKHSGKYSLCYKNPILVLQILNIC